MWICLDTLPRGAWVTVTLTTGSAELDGHPLHPWTPMKLQRHHLNYFVHTWTECSLTLRSTHCDDVDKLVMRIKSASMHPYLTEYIPINRVLVIDYEPSVAITLANYKYRHQNLDPTPGQPNNDPRPCHILFNLDNRVNSPGVVHVYTLDGTIPPHHPLDCNVNTKTSFYCYGQTADDDLLTAATRLQALTCDGDVVTVHMHVSQMDYVSDVVRRFGINHVVTTNDWTYYKMRQVLTDTPVSVVTSMISGNVPTMTSEEAIYHGIFLQQYRPHHFEIDNKKFLNRLPPNLRQCDIAGQRMDVAAYSNSNGPLSSRVYAIVTKPENMQQDDLMVFWGYLMVDHNNRWHSIFPPNTLNRRAIRFIEVSYTNCI